MNPDTMSGVTKTNLYEHHYLCHLLLFKTQFMNEILLLASQLMHSKIMGQ